MSVAKTTLSDKETKIVAISMYTAQGDMDKLKTALSAGLDAGVSINEIKEILVQLYAYCGFPRSLNALTTFMALTQERQAAGITDTEGKLPGPAPTTPSRDFGADNQTKLVGQKVTGALFSFAPAIDDYLKAHLFGDIFARDNLDWRTREIVTIAALSSMPGVESQLTSHIAVGKRNGVTDAQIKEILALTQSPKATDVFAKGDQVGARFTGAAWVAHLVSNKDYDLAVYNVTFAPGVRNDWHKHAVGQLLLCTVGVGYYQERGKAAERLTPGTVVEIPANTDHWHGAAPDCEFVHIGMTPKMSENNTVWLEPVTDAEYAQATAKK